MNATAALSDDHVEALLGQLGINFSPGTRNHSWHLPLLGYGVILFLANNNTDGQLYIAFGNESVSAERINEWNKTRRFGRAYADDDNHPALESDLDFAGGVTDDIIKAWIRLFETQIHHFVAFLGA